MNPELIIADEAISALDIDTGTGSKSNEGTSKENRSKISIYCT